jgi:hypothetical protein
MIPLFPTTTDVFIRASDNRQLARRLTMKFLTHVLLISSLVLSASVAGAQNPQDPKPVNRPSPEQDVDTLKIDTNLVTVPVIASSRTGSYIADLKKEEFKLTEDGVRAGDCFPRVSGCAFLCRADAGYQQ